MSKLPPQRPMLRPSSKSCPRVRPVLLLAGLVVLLGGCQQDNDPGPGGVTVGEARALDEAAAMLDAQGPAPTPGATPAAGS